MDASRLSSAVQSIIDPRVVTVDANAVLVEVIHQYFSHSESITKTACILVTNETGIAGIWTPSDAVRLAAQHVDINHLTIADVMTQPVITLSEAELHNPLIALSILQQRQINHLPIVDSWGQPIGIVSSSSAQQGLQLPHLLKLYRVADVLDSRVVQAPAHETALNLAKQMTEQHTSYLVITSANSSEQLSAANGLPPVGIVTFQNVLQAWATGSDLSQVPATSIMESSIRYVAPSDSLWLAFQEMQRAPYLLVANPQGRLEGVLTELNFLQILSPMQMNRSVRQLRRSIQHLRAEKNELLQSHNLELERLVQARTAQLSELYEQLQVELAERKQAEAALKKANEELELRVQERTAKWQQVTERLLDEIAERNRLEDEATQAKDQLQAVLDAVPGLVSWISSDLKYIGVNQQLAAAFHRTTESFIEQPLGFMGQSPEFRDFIEEFFASSDQTAVKELTFEVDQQLSRYLMVVQKYDQDRAAVSVGIDVTDWKQAEQDFHNSEAKFRNLVEQTNDWVWEVDAQLKFTYVNPRVEDITGYTASEMLQRRIFEFMPEDEAVRLTTLLEYVVNGRESFSQIETTLLHKAGQPLVLEISGAPVFGPHGEWHGYRGISRDITERKQVERNIRKALTKEKELNELKTRFISMASHEFRTPLTTILASAECLEHYHNKWPEEKKLLSLQRIQGAAKRMTELLNDVLILGRAEMGKAKLNLAPLDLEDLCLELVEELLLSQPTTRNIQFSTTTPNLQAWVDEKLLRHILLNLLSNALKYSPDDKPVELCLMEGEGSVTFQIKDQGIGIPLEDQSCLFEPFHRANNVGTISGTGLGLAIVKKSVEAHGGTIKFTSHVGEGTTFTVHIPVGTPKK